MSTGTSRWGKTGVWTPGRIGGGRGNGRMGNSKEREAGEMSGEKLRNHSFQEKRGGADAKYGRRELRFGPPLSLKRLVLCFQGCVCHLPLMCLYVIFACLRCFSFLLFLVKKRRPKLC